MQPAQLITSLQKQDYIIMSVYRLSVNYAVSVPHAILELANQFMITRALHFAQLRQAYYQACVTITLGRRV